MYPISVASAVTLSTNAGEIFPLPERIIETAAMEMPAASATSFKVVFFIVTVCMKITICTDKLVNKCKNVKLIYFLGDNLASVNIRTILGAIGQ